MAFMLLIYPPSARCTEAPLGIARLAACLRSAGREVGCIDLCQEGIEYLLHLDVKAEDKRGRGSIARRGRAAESLRNSAAYGNPSRYARAVDDLGRALRLASGNRGVEASLADYRDENRSPLRRTDLLDAAAGFRDNVFYPLFESRVAPALNANVDAWVGISLCYLSQALCAFALIGYVKSIRPDIRIVVGGGLVTSWIAGGMFGSDGKFGGLADAMIAGPGEEPLLRLLGIARSPTEDPLALEDFSALRYFAPTRIVPYNFSSGCPWKRCSFCPEKAENMPYSGLPAAEAAARISRLGLSYEPGLYHFTDSEIAPGYLDALVACPPSAPWYGFARFSSRLLDLDFCRALRASGCVMLQLGLESGDQGVLDRIGKGTKVDEIAVILDNLAEAGIGTYVYVLFGTPEEDRGAAMRTRDFVASRSDRIGFLNVAVFNLPAASVEAKSLDTRNFYEGDLSLYREFSHPSGWDRTAVRRFLEEDFQAIPEIRSIVKRTPPVFSSNHAPFFPDFGAAPISGF